MKWNRCAAMAMAALVACALAMSAHAAPKAGDVPPDALGKTPKGEEIRISDHRGQVMVVSFWASWCGYCRKMFPALDYLQGQVDPALLRVVVVNFKEDVQTYRSVVRHARKSSVTWTHDRTGAVSDAYGVDSVPRLFVIDKAGEVALVRVGYSEESLPKLFERINELLAEPAPQEVVPAETPPLADVESLSFPSQASAATAGAAIALQERGMPATGGDVLLPVVP